MTVASLIQALQQVDPNARVLTRWEGELHDIEPNEIALISAHPDQWEPKKRSAAHEEECEDDEGICFRCVEDTPARWGCFKAVVIG